MFGEGIAPELKELFIEELNELLNKYLKISHEEIGNVRKIIEMFNKQEEASKKQERLESILEKAELLKEHSIEEIEIQVWLENKFGGKVDVDEAKEYLDELLRNGGVRIENMIAYDDRRTIESILKEVLEEMLKDSYHIERLLDKEQLVEMWLEGTSKEEVVKDLIDGCVPEDLLDTTEQEAYTSSNGDTIMYMKIEI